jgi:hypothetical protein
VSGAASDFYVLAEILCEGSGVEDLILDWLGAIDGEAANNFCFIGLFLDRLLLRLWFFGNALGLGLFCGH